MLRALAVLSALSVILTAGSGFALMMGSGATTGHVILGLVSVTLVVLFSNQVYQKYCR